MRKKFDEVIKFTLSGVLFGLFFPILATTIEIFHHGYPLNLNSFFTVQQDNFLLWIIDSAVPILGFFGFLIGRRQQQLKTQAQMLENCVKDRSTEILEQKLFYEALVDNSPIAIVTLDPQHRILSANPAFEEIFGFSSDVILGEKLDELISNEDTEQEAHEITKKVLSGETIHHFGKRRRFDGKMLDVEILGKPILINGKLSGVLGLYRDISAEKKAREDLKASETRFKSLFQNSPVALRLEDLSDMHQRVEIIQRTFGVPIKKYLEMNPDEINKLLSMAKIISVNQAALALFNAPDIVGFQKHLNLIVSEESQDSVVDFITSLSDGNTSMEQEMIYKTLDGEKKYMVTQVNVLPGHESDWSFVLFSNTDITDRKHAEERMTYISLHDMMTGLYNRAFFDEELNRLDNSRIRPIAILVCDMDNLKKINDQYGHKAGDIALQNIAAILQSCFRSEDVVARIGGDEFAVLLPHMNDKAAKAIIHRIDQRIEKHNASCPQDKKVHLSIGFCTAGEHESLHDTFKIADKNMYLEKEKKRIIA